MQSRTQDLFARLMEHAASVSPPAPMPAQDMIADLMESAGLAWMVPPPPALRPQNAQVTRTPFTWTILSEGFSKFGILKGELVHRTHALCIPAHLTLTGPTRTCRASLPVSSTMPLPSPRPSCRCGLHHRRRHLRRRCLLLRLLPRCLLLRLLSRWRWCWFPAPPRCPHPLARQPRRLCPCRRCPHTLVPVLLCRRRIQRPTRCCRLSPSHSPSPPLLPRRLWWCLHSSSVCKLTRTRSSRTMTRLPWRPWCTHRCWLAPCGLWRSSRCTPLALL